VSYAIRLQNVRKAYAAHVAVDDLSLDVVEGRITGFLGPNGAGKTTTLRMIMSILYPDAGRVEVLGHPRAIDVKDRVGYLPEERGLYRRMTVNATLHYLGRLKGMRGGALRDRIRDLLQSVDLSFWADKRIEALSKGMSQKLQFIATILHDPELVILDEPFSGLDPLNTELLKDMMMQLRADGRTVIYSTHQMEQAQRLSDRLVLINRGRKLIDGTMEEIRSQFESRMIHLEGEGDFSALTRRAGVVASHMTDGRLEIEIAPGADAQDLLREALQLGRVLRFDVGRLGLHDIFVRLVNQDRASRGQAPVSAVGEHVE